MLYYFEVNAKGRLKPKISVSDDLLEFWMKLRLDIDAGGNGSLGIVGIQEWSSQFSATSTASSDSQLSLQIAHRTCPGGDGFFDFVIGNGVADAYEHDVLRVFFCLVLIDSVFYS